MRLRITSDGTRAGTRIFDATTDEDITGKVRLVKVWIMPDRDPVTEVTLRGVETEIAGELDV